MHLLHSLAGASFARAASSAGGLAYSAHSSLRRETAAVQSWPSVISQWFGFPGTFQVQRGAHLYAQTPSRRPRIQAVLDQKAKRENARKPKPEWKNKKLYVDAVHFASYFFVRKAHWDLRMAHAQVMRFAEAAKNSGYELTAYVDEAMPSDDAKWKLAREDEVRTSLRTVPIHTPAMLAELFR